MVGKYSGIPLYGHPCNKDTSLLRTVFFVPGERLYISLRGRRKKGKGNEEFGRAREKGKGGSPPLSFLARGLAP